MSHALEMVSSHNFATNHVSCIKNGQLLQSYNNKIDYITCIRNGKLLISYNKICHMRQKWSAVIVLQQTKSHAFEMVSCDNITTNYVICIGNGKLLQSCNESCHTLEMVSCYTLITNYVRYIGNAQLCQLYTNYVTCIVNIGNGQFLKSYY